MEALGFEGDFLELTKMLYKEITSQIIVNGKPTNKIDMYTKRCKTRLSIQYDLVCVKYNPLDQYDQGRKENHWTYHQTLTPSEGPELCG